MEFHPLTYDRWNDLKTLFGQRGACGGCWCMYWRLSRREFDSGKGAPNRDRFRRLVKQGPPPGILAYDGSRPIGWCAVAPREDYSALSRSRILKPIDDQTCWSVTCFFIHKDYRRQGVSVELLREAIEFAGKYGCQILEGYPVEPKQDSMPPAFAWYGIASAYLQAGFTECARRSATRPIMRYHL